MFFLNKDFELPGQLPGRWEVGKLTRPTYQLPGQLPAREVDREVRKVNMSIGYANLPTSRLKTRF